MTDQRLLESGRGVADGSGRATASIGTYREGETWTVTRMTVISTSQTLVPTAIVYRNAETPTRIIDGTYTGTLDTNDTTAELQTGEELLCVWTGADIGAECTLVVEGVRHLP